MSDRKPHFVITVMRDGRTATFSFITAREAFDAFTEYKKKPFIADYVGEIIYAVLGDHKGAHQHFVRDVLT